MVLSLCSQELPRSDTREDAQAHVAHHAAAGCDAGGERRAPDGACEAGGAGRKGVDPKPWTEEEDAILSEQVRVRHSSDPLAGIHTPPKSSAASGIPAHAPHGAAESTRTHAPRDPAPLLGSCHNSSFPGCPV